MRKPTFEGLVLFGGLGGGIVVVLLAIAVKLAFWVAVIWGIVKLIGHITGGG